MAIGYVPVPRPERVGRRGRARSAREFVRATDATPHARLLLEGVVDTSGKPLTNAGNQLVIDALVSPSSAGAPPFVVPFDIHDGAAFLDVPLAVPSQPDGPVRVQILGAEVVDPDGQPFGVLGFELRGLPPTPIPGSTPMPSGTLDVEGQCFATADCTGPSFQTAQRRCCRAAHANPERAPVASGSWCPPEQFDPATGRCLASACVVCGSGPQAGACVDGAQCTGACTLVCADGTTAVGQCAPSEGQRCACGATCGAPTPCALGQCFDTLTFQCTGQPCGPDRGCLLPQQVCDVSGRRCACSSPPAPAPHGRICCQCKDQVAACFTVSSADVQPICPPECETFVGQECNAEWDHCVPPLPCSAEQDCDDENGCTIDHCTAGACTHDCVCAGPAGCGPGPGRR